MACSSPQHTTAANTAAAKQSKDLIQTAAKTKDRPVTKVTSMHACTRAQRHVHMYAQEGHTWLKTRIAILLIVFSAGTSSWRRIPSSFFGRCCFRRTQQGGLANHVGSRHDPRGAPLCSLGVSPLERGSIDRMLATDWMERRGVWHASTCRVDAAPVGRSALCAGREPLAAKSRSGSGRARRQRMIGVCPCARRRDHRRRPAQPGPSRPEAPAGRVAPHQSYLGAAEEAVRSRRAVASAVRHLRPQVGRAMEKKQDALELAERTAVPTADEVRRMVRKKMPGRLKVTSWRLPQSHRQSHSPRLSSQQNPRR